MTYLSVIIPFYNEQTRIFKSLKTIVSYLNKQDYSYEIILVDDGSQDDTKQILKNFLNNSKIRILKNNINSGKGNAVKRGMLAATGQLSIFTDADLSTPISEIEKLLAWANKGYNIVIGSRGLSHSNIHIRQSFHREKMGRIFNIIVQLLLFKGIKDTQCGFKLFKSDVSKSIFEQATINRFCFDVEILFIAIKSGQKIKEVPVDWYNSPNSKVKIPQDAIMMLIDLLMIKLKHGFK